MNEREIILEINGVEINSRVTFDYTPPVRGVYHLAPENCFPSEPEEFELTGLTVGDSDWSCILTDKVTEAIVEQLKDMRNED